MPTRYDHPYLLEEFSESQTTPMDPQQIATMFVEINAKLDTIKIFEERLAKVEATREPLEYPQVINPYREITDITTPITHPILMLNI